MSLPVPTMDGYYVIPNQHYMNSNMAMDNENEINHGGMSPYNNKKCEFSFQVLDMVCDSKL